MDNTTINQTATLELHEVACWLLPEDKCWIRITLASGAQWIVPLAWVNDRVAKYYEEEGWYEQCELDDDPELKQLTGEDLRSHVYVNDASAEHIREERWSRVREYATHFAGPADEPPDDKLWAVLEQGGAIDLVTTIPLAEQRKAEPLLVCDVEPAAIQVAPVHAIDSPPRIWSDDIVFRLNASQHDHTRHGYTCGNDSRHRPLIATPQGWRCADCNYTQVELP